MTKLLASGRTDLLSGFISARTRRKFSAYLVRGNDGKVGFEFEKKEAKPKATGKKAATAKTKGKGKMTDAPPVGETDDE